MRRQTITSFLLTLTALVTGLFAGGRITGHAWAAGKEPYTALDTLARALAQIRVNYVEEVDEDRLIWAAIQGMTRELDEQSTYLTPEAWAALQSDNDGNTGGIGAVVSADSTKGLLVEEVLPRSPAALAGLRVGDHIVSVNGQSALGLSLDEALNLVRGPRGTKVVLELMREGEDAGLQVELVRDLVHAPSAKGLWVQKGLAYIHVEQFRHGCAEQVASELERLEREQGSPASALILDLRENPGGLLQEALGVADLFLKEGVVVSTRGRAEATAPEVLTASAQTTDRDLPLVVLVNEHSASASEIVAGALQDHKRATVIGAPTWGKGSVQSYFEYPDHSALKLTIAHYYLPSGRMLRRGEGITPDQEVLLPLADQDPVSAMRAVVDQSKLTQAERQRLLQLVEQLPPSDHPAQRVSPQFSGTMSQRLRQDAQLAAAVARLEPALK